MSLCQIASGNFSSILIPAVTHTALKGSFCDFVLFFLKAEQVREVEVLENPSGKIKSAYAGTTPL